MPSAAYTADEIWTLSKRETDVFTMDFTDALAYGETLLSVSGNTTVGNTTLALGVSVPTGITAGSRIINTGDVTVDNGVVIVTGKCIQVRLSAVTATTGQIYDIRFTSTTSGSNVLEQYGRLEVLG